MKAKHWITIMAFLFFLVNFVTPVAAQKVGLNVGDKAPDINLPGPDGQKIALSSLQGKIVLVDFWASWCMPCRQENPKIRRVYKKYKDANFKNADGFTVYSVSLDKYKSAWVKAIQEDKLEWKNHVSDLNYWQCSAALRYHVYAIPYNFLIDQNGIIIAKGLSYEMLGNELDKLLAD